MSAAAAQDRTAAPQDADALHRSYLLYRDGLYLKIALAICALAVLTYWIYSPAHGHSGSTWLGFTLGTLSAGLTGWLAWFGIRKRQYRTGAGVARAWLSAHVYLGLTLWLLATLHSGFQFGWNLHTLTYLLLSLVIGSGLYGAAAYAVYPARITANRQQLNPDAMLEEIAQLNSTALRLSQKLDAETQDVVSRSAVRVRIGGNLWHQVSGRYPKPAFELNRGEIMKHHATSTGENDPLPPVKEVGDQTIAFMANRLFESTNVDGERKAASEQASRLLDALAQRNALVDRLNRDITLRARQNAWLFLHVPLTVALLTALVAHVLSVFMYR